MKDRYTIVIMSSAESGVRQYSIGRWSLKFLYLVCFFILAGAVGSAVYGAIYQNKWRSVTADKDRLDSENQKLHLELKSEQEYLRQEVRKIQKMADMAGEVLGLDQQKGVLGQGGNGSEIKESDGSENAQFVSQAEPVFSAGISEYIADDSQLAQISQLKNELNYIHKQVMAEVEKYRQQPSILPIFVPKDSKTKTYWYSSGFGPRVDPLTKQRKPHYGVDISTRKNTRILAAADGVISKIQKRKSGLGNVIWINHEKIQMETVYGHMNKFAEGMRRGKKVKRGEIIGYVGNSGRSTGSHLHYGVYVNGNPVNPRRHIIDEWGDQSDSDSLK